jgi:hypothetical protein
MREVFTKENSSVRHLSISSLMGFLIFLGLSKFEGLTLLRFLNHERVDAILVTVTQ